MALPFLPVAVIYVYNRINQWRIHPERTQLVQAEVELLVCLGKKDFLRLLQEAEVSWEASLVR